MPSKGIVNTFQIWFSAQLMSKYDLDEVFRYVVSSVDFIETELTVGATQ